MEIILGIVMFTPHRLGVGTDDSVCQIQVGERRRHHHQSQ